MARHHHPHHSGAPRRLVLEYVPRRDSARRLGLVFSLLVRDLGEENQATYEHATRAVAGARAWPARLSTEEIRP
jgi:hypothetical protein